ncbi:MAG TPA: acyl-CoA desaturase [Solirubrobacteraceae bacterium]|nr:acyl-CoA desaturase [Solirubrobacteraceae bacterium]
MQSAVIAPDTEPCAEDIEPCSNETADRIATGIVTIVPLLALGLVIWQAWESLLQWHDFVVFGIVYVLTGLGITVGFHRHFTHRAFATSKPVRAVLAVLGTAAIEGPITAWVADHRKHHAFSDQAGDPHSPHVDHGHGLRGALRGLAHAHIGWLFLHTQRANKARYAPDLVDDPLIRFIDRTTLLWIGLGLAVPFGLGYLLGGTLVAGLTGLLWGGAMRILLLHHMTYSINSLCHFFGRQRFATGDESRNLVWLAPLTFGEAWHNNHHAFPTSAAHGMRRWERAMDPSALVIGGMERAGLVWDVVKISDTRQNTKLTAAARG